MSVRSEGDLHGVGGGRWGGTRGGETSGVGGAALGEPKRLWPNWAHGVRETSQRQFPRVPLALRRVMASGDSCQGKVCEQTGCILAAGVRQPGLQARNTV